VDTAARLGFDYNALVRSLNFIASLTSCRMATHFCYPSGVTHLSYPAWRERLGVKSPTTCFPGIASSTFNPMFLPRFIDTVAASPIEFETWLSGVSALLPRRAVRAGHVDS
jgi:hypothetical protein